LVCKQIGDKLLLLLGEDHEVSSRGATSDFI